MASESKNMKHLRTIAAEAYRAGQEDMRERAKVAANDAAYPYSKSQACNAVRVAVCRAIESLPPPSARRTAMSNHTKDGVR